MDPCGVEVLTTRLKFQALKLFQMDPCGVEVITRSVSIGGCMWFQMDPCGVEVTCFRCYDCTLMRFRWTLVGLKFDEVVGTVGLMETDADGNYESPFGESASDLTGAIDSFFGMIGVVFIVIVLAVILAYLYAMRGNGR